MTMDPLWGTQLTNMWMANPYMFDPTQKSNQFSNYNNQRIPYPPTYNPGLAGGPVNAATGQPIQSYQQWAQQNPGGMTLNATAQMPPAPPMADPNAGLRATLAGMGGYQGNPALGAYLAGQGPSPGQARSLAAMGYPAPPGPPGPGPTGGTAATPQGAPNNWQAALNALANPGRVQTPGASVPLQTGSQPAGGVNQAFLNQAGAGQGMNQNFLSALRAIQGR
jgi:hypothetical protein